MKTHKSLLLFICITFLFSTNIKATKKNKTSLNAKHTFKLLANVSIKQNLINIKKLRPHYLYVRIILKNGSSYDGKIGKIGQSLLTLTSIVGREHYDMLIKTQEIVAIMVRMKQILKPHKKMK